jgi:hypothetical protein
MATPAINSLGGANRLNDTWRYLFSCKTQICNVSRGLTSSFDSDSVLVTRERQDTTGATAPKLDTQQGQVKSNY